MLTRKTDSAPLIQWTWAGGLPSWLTLCWPLYPRWEPEPVERFRKARSPLHRRFRTRPLWSAKSGHYLNSIQLAFHNQGKVIKKHHTVNVVRQLFLTESWDLVLHTRSNTWGKLEDPWRVMCQLKKPFKGPRQRQGSFWKRNSLMRGHWFTLKMIFFTKKKHRN